MQNGVVVISPQEAIRKAGEMKKLAGDIEDLLNACSNKINEIDNVETGICLLYTSPSPRDRG